MPPETSTTKKSQHYQNLRRSSTINIVITLSTVMQIQTFMTCILNLYRVQDTSLLRQSPG